MRHLTLAASLLLFCSHGHASSFDGFYSGSFGPHPQNLWFAEVAANAVRAYYWDHAEGEADYMSGSVDASGGFTLRLNFADLVAGTISGDGSVSGLGLGFLSGYQFVGSRHPREGQFSEAAGVYEAYDDNWRLFYAAVTPDGAVYFFTMYLWDLVRLQLSVNGSFSGTSPKGYSITGSIDPESWILAVSASQHLFQQSAQLPRVRGNLGAGPTNPFGALADLGSSIRYDQRFGFVYDAAWPWLWIFGVDEWLYWMGDRSSAWVWTLGYSWGWTSETYWPFVWLADFDAWRDFFSP